MTTLENRYRLHCTGEEPKAQRGYIAGLGNISIKCLLNGRAGTYIQIAYFFPSSPVLRYVGILFIFPSPLNQGEYLTLMNMFVKWVNDPGN